MTITEKERSALEAYGDVPTPAGDLVLLFNEEVIIELEGGADHWEQLRPFTFLREIGGSAHRVVPAIARPGADLLDSDRTLWAELCEVVREAGVEVGPLQALRAA